MNVDMYRVGAIGVMKLHQDIRDVLAQSIIE